MFIAASVFIVKTVKRVARVGQGIKDAMQHTLKKPVTLRGVGLHSGRPVTMTIRPAPFDHGIVFKRVDVDSSVALIPALYDCVVDTRLCTLIANESGVRVGTVEHVMAALRGCGIDNALLELDAGEVPVMDGSARPFTEAIDSVGSIPQSAPRRALRILKPVEVRDGEKIVRLSPSATPVFSGRIEFSHPDIGVQEYSLRLVNGNFRHDVSDCRTFGFAHEAEALRAVGLGLGGSLENAVILDDCGVMNPEGLRCADEFVRHKILDAVGDLYLAGGPILGAYYGYKGGHAMNNMLLHALFSDSRAFERVDLFVDTDEVIPSVYDNKKDTSLPLLV